MRRAAVLLLTAALLASPAGAQPSGATPSAPLSMDASWLRLVKFAADKGLTTEVADRANGRFVASGSKVWALYIRCPRKLKDVGYDLDVTLAPDGAGGTAVIATVNGSADQVRRRHFLMFKGRQVRREFECPSTGVLETELLQALSAAKP